MKTVLPALALLACASPAAPTAAAPATPPQQLRYEKKGPEEAKQFVASVNQQLRRYLVEQSTADWIKSTYITDDTERNSASAGERLLGYSSDMSKEAVNYKNLQLDPDTARSLYLLRISSPVLDDPEKRMEMATLGAKLEGYYGKAKDKKGRDLEQLSDILRLSQKYDELLDAWLSWHDT